MRKNSNVPIFIQNPVGHPGRRADLSVGHINVSGTQGRYQGRRLRFHVVPKTWVMVQATSRNAT